MVEFRIKKKAHSCDVESEYRQCVDNVDFYASTKWIRTMGAGVIEEQTGLSGPRSEASPQGHDSGLLIIGIFKILKSALFFGIGIGAIHMLHKDLGDTAMRLATALRFDPEGHFVSGLLAKVDLIDVHHLRQIGIATFGYSALALTEGIGLLKEQVWAEYLTLCLTISFLPWECYELTRDASPIRWGLLAANLAVLGYLVWLLKRKKRLKEARGKSASL